MATCAAGAAVAARHPTLGREFAVGFALAAIARTACAPPVRPAGA
jgi:hypothetical protein